MVKRAAPIVMDYPYFVYVPHLVQLLLSSAATQHFWEARHTGYEVTLLSNTNITIKKMPPVNLATLLPAIGDCDETPDRDCVEVVGTCTTPRPDLQQTPLEKADYEWYTDGSSSRLTDTDYRAGYAVTTVDTIIESATLPPGTSAQQAELYAVTRACILADGKSVNIYTDSRYAFGVVHDFGQLWQYRGFITAAGRPIQNGLLVKNLLKAILLPNSIAVIKCEAHTGANTKIARGNAKADTAARESMLQPIQMVPLMAKSIPKIQLIQRQLLLAGVKEAQWSAALAEERVWTDAGCLQNDEGLWVHQDGRPVAPRSMFLPLARLAHGPTHMAQGGMNELIRQEWFAPGITAFTAQFCSQCLVCAQHTKGLSPATHDHLPVPQGPFTNVQIDFAYMPPVNGFKYLLVCVDQFSKWVEAFPTRKNDAATVVRCLMKDIIPRFGVPQGINSDRGGEFVATVVQKMCECLGIEWKLHAPYHPQSSGQVERMNSTIKID
ncbi:protein NYNRIN-like [Pleurodeles waltl]|uniref:protein NYNRIN-like n=1 Tax=Pleurodeles waltl TaxID=8319 RepID=UPI003709C359